MCETLIVTLTPIPALPLIDISKKTFVLTELNMQLDL